MNPTMMVPGMGTGPDISLFMLGMWSLVVLAITIFGFTVLGVLTLPVFFGVLFGLEAALSTLQTTGSLAVGVVLMTFRGLRRNLLRTSLTYVALFVFVGMLTLIFSVVYFFEGILTEKNQDVKVILTEKFQVPSQMKRGYTAELVSVMKTDLPPEMQPDFERDVMTWSFVGGSLDPNNRTLENSLFMFAQDPHTLLTMSDGLQPKDLNSEADHEALVAAVEEMKKDKRNILIGKDKLRKMDKKVGDDFKLYSMNYKDLVFDYHIAGTFPDSRYDGMATMRLDYLFAKLDDYEKTKGQAHPQADRCINLVWVRLPTREAYERLAGLVDEKRFNSPAVKLETASAGIGSFMDAYRDIFFGIKYILMPALALIMALVVSITMTIAIRERLTETAVLKVLGFPPFSVFAMILGEGVLVGLLAGTICTWLFYFTITLTNPGGIRFPIAFFPAFKVDAIVLLYGPLLGAITAGLGTLLPALSGTRVKASEVFSQVA